MLRKFLKKIVIFISIFITSTLVSISTHEQKYIGVDYEQLAYCSESTSRILSKSLLYVTTLDGKISALDLSQKGRLYWEVPTGPGPLISSSIHHLELTNNGQLVRLIPSLNGGIYKFDGETIDAIPMTAENLLSSSFKFSDDLVISGGKETRSYGVSVRTGQILYECSIHGCLNNTRFESNSSPQTGSLKDKFVNEEHDELLDDIVLIRRQTQTVRAVEPRTGNERWNFSVGQHEIEMLKSPECHERPLSKFDMLFLDIKVIVPEGIICAFSKSNPNTILWKHQFDHPIVSVWKMDVGDTLKHIDLFDSAQWVWNSNNDHILDDRGMIAPSIYLGMFKKQLYIQESQNLHQLLIKNTKRSNYHLMESDNTYLLAIPWKPLAAKKVSSTPLIDNNIGISSNDPLIDIGGEQNNESKTTVTALSILYASEYMNGDGVYLYSSNDLNKCLSNTTANRSISVTDEENVYFEIGGETPVKIIIISIWYWWKEIVLISLTTGLLLNICFSPKVKHKREVVVIERHIAVPTAFEATEESMCVLAHNTQRSDSESNGSSNDYFSSRFQSDFHFVRCLGKGGFGVVFEAKNILDDCNYAVKRIELPNKKEKKDRVMREVKTLANCEHHNIVRYFQAWMEMPPPGWQEEQDAKWFCHDISTASIDIETHDGTTLPSFPKNYNFNDRAGNEKKNRKNLWTTKVEPNINPKFTNKEIVNSNLQIDINDSYKQFEAETANESFVPESSKKISDKSHSTSAFERKIFRKNFDSESFQIEFENSSHNEDDIELKLNKTNISTANSFEHKGSLSFDFSNSSLKALQPTLNTQSKYFPKQKNCKNKIYLYIQMQLCRKESLRDWLREHRIEMRQPHTQSIFQQIVDAVEYVHQKGLIHRDLKPSNIFFSLDGQIRIGDFGLVTDMPETPNYDFRILSTINSEIDSTTKNSYTQQVGTHLYMSPEQLRGHSYDFRVDIYSLGLIFFELLVYFGTEMEKILTIKDLRAGIFPNNFQSKFPEEHDLLKLMLSNEATRRPATHVIKDKLMNMISWVNTNFRSIDANKVREFSEISNFS